jgi:hypothetical protein
MNPTVWIVWRVETDALETGCARLTTVHRTVFGVYANESTARNRAATLNATAKSDTIAYEVEEVEVQG